MKNILCFNTMLTPKIITFVYWLLLAWTAYFGFEMIFGRYEGFTVGNLVTGVFYTAGMALGARIWCELLIVLFKMNEALQDLRNK